MDGLLEIPPARSPLLLPTDRALNRTNSTDKHLSFSSERDVLDDMEFIAAGNWAEEEDVGEEDESDDEDSLGDFSLEDGHIVGVPSSPMRLEAKQYQAPEFATAVLELLRDDLKIHGWSTLPLDCPSSLIHIHKVSGSLTNAVFFVSIPAANFDVVPESSSSSTTPSTPSTMFSQLHLEEGTGLERSSTPKPKTNGSSEAQSTLTVEAPTLLLRIYGPASGSLISRKTELHILHTLSADYGIGPKVFGTFSNGRVEQFFVSRALHKEEMRDARISRWIGRRMRELHRVELEKMEVPGATNERDASSNGKRDERPPMDMGTRYSSGSSGSVYSTSSGSSVFSFGASHYSSSSAGSTSSLATIGSEYGTPVNSPLLLPRRGSSESRAAQKKRSRSVTSSRGRRANDKLGVWENITRWTREAKLVLKEFDQLAALPGFSSLLATTTPPPSTPSSSSPPDGSSTHIPPLSSPSATFSLRAALNLPLFEQQVKLYRNYVREWEKREGKSKRVFSHNDTQYGNLLLLTPEPGEERALERLLQAPHQKIIVVDFEYASANPRGFDLANHFIEWQADYHHPTHPHSLSFHSTYPTPSERRRFLRAYIGCDSGHDGNEDEESEGKKEDPRVGRLEEEVRVWEPSSHAMWATWGIVQARDQILPKIEEWKQACEKRTKGEETERGEEGEAEFDYLSYSLGRMNLFRKELKELGIVD